MKNFIIILSMLLISANACTGVKKNSDNMQSEGQKEEKYKPISPKDIKVEKNFLYDQHTLADTYPYNKTTRQFQWDKISEGLSQIETIQQKPRIWGVLQNNKNNNGEAELVKDHQKDEYNREEDAYGVDRYQSVPLYRKNDLDIPERYGRDGSLVEVIKDSTDFVEIKTIYFDGKWMVPKKYVKVYTEPQVFSKAIFVDRNNQNIATLEKEGSTWYVRSMNPVTTGAHKPPYQHPTPLGIFVVQQKKDKMSYYKDGTTEIAGFAPYASRFTNGAYLHGVPVNLPHTQMVELSPTLGTVPHSHMCVRNATSHAKFLYDWAKVYNTLVFVIE